MVQKIKQDHSRFKEIIKGRIKKNLKKYITKGELLGKKGKDIVSIPLPQIEIPKFRFGHKNTGGVGQGDGEEGQVLQPGQVQPGDGKEAGDQPGEHVLEVDVTLEELAEIMGEELELPRIEPKGKKNIIAEKLKYTGVYTAGPESLRHFKRTYRQALQRQIASGTYNPKRPMVIPHREDKRYRAIRITRIPTSSAVIIYMMDVSGSMGEEQKEIVRIESFWIETWLSANYEGIESRYIIHDAVAREVDRETFFHTRESGGTMISSAYKLCDKIIDEDYNPSEWNIYPFHFSDGDNWSTDDSSVCIKLLKEKMLAQVNMFCYGQVESQYGSGQFIKELGQHLSDNENLVTSEIKGKDGIFDSIKEFLGKGK